MGGTSGSPLQARLEVNVFSVILILAAIIVVITVVYMISKIITNYLNSPEYIEKKKNRPTSQKDINEIATRCSLSKEEKDILSNICKNNRTPNIKYIVNDYATMQDLFRSQFITFDKNGDEIGKSHLFLLQKKVFKVFRQQEKLKNSKNIAAQTVLTLTVAKGFHHKLTMVDNNSEAIVLEIPHSIKNEELPKPLEKVSFIFELEDGTPYNLETRVVRYQKGKNGENQMVIVHSDKISPLQKREQERAEINVQCEFRSVKVVVENEGKKEKVRYVPSDKAHEGVIEDISTGGCRLIAKLPIKADQNIYIDGPLNKKQNDHVVGTIVRTTKRSDGIYILHIRFLRIDMKVVNRIQAMVSKFDD